MSWSPQIRTFFGAQIWDIHGSAAAKMLLVCGLSSVVTSGDDIVSFTWEMMAQQRT